MSKVLIIGDFFIDENWLVAKHNSSNSSHTGDFHYLSKHDELNKRMTSFCGVPEILVMIKEKCIDYSFLSYGVWNKNDDKVIKCILCDKITKFTMYSIKGVSDIKDDICPYEGVKCKYGQELINMASEEPSSTNRIVRVYEGHSGGKPNLLYRFDWELPVKKINYDSLIKDIKENDIKAIIIEDHNKGVITSELIKKIFDSIPLDKNKKIRWYIRSKVDNPKWLEILIEKLSQINNKVRLRVIDNKLAQKMDQRRWTYGKELGRASLELLGELSGAIVYRDGRPIGKNGKYISDSNLSAEGHTERVAVLLDNNTVIAKDSNRCFNLHKAPGQKQIINVGRTTAFFSSLVLQDLNCENQEFGEQCKNALCCAFEWSKNASISWNKGDFHFYGNYRTALDHEKINTNIPLECSEYLNSWREWNESSNSLGIIQTVRDNKSVQVIQTWRGESTLEGYICTGGPKRTEIGKLISNISHYAIEKQPKHPYNCLFLADPGWGKSFLAQSLATHFDMQFMEFSLSQMVSTKDLVDSFDLICSYQNQNSKKVLILMDEVNCKIEGSTALGLLLNPIWDGKFARGGRIYKLLPAIWIFASTGSVEEIMNENKGEDFISRINGPIITLDNKHIKGNIIPEYIKTEQVYIGIFLLNKYWGPISRIENSVLSLFNNIEPANGIRSLEFFVSKFQNIQRGEVNSSNIPQFSKFPELIRHINMKQHLEYTSSSQDNAMINIETLLKKYY